MAQNNGIPEDYTPCEEYRGFVIGVKNGWYEIFPTDKMKKEGWVRPEPPKLGSSRQEMRRYADFILATVDML